MTTTISATMADSIYDALSARIVAGGELPAGEKLRQDHIAREFGTSHVPVREALLRLELMVWRKASRAEACV